MSTLCSPSLRLPIRLNAVLRTPTVSTEYRDTVISRSRGRRCCCCRCARLCSRTADTAATRVGALRNLRRPRPIASCACTLHSPYLAITLQPATSTRLRFLASKTRQNYEVLSLPSFFLFPRLFIQFSLSLSYYPFCTEAYKLLICSVGWAWAAVTVSISYSVFSDNHWVNCTGPLRNREPYAVDSLAYKPVALTISHVTLYTSTL